MAHDTPHNRQSQAQSLVKYWPIVVTLLGVFAGLVTLNNKVDGHTEDIRGLKAADVHASTVNNQILVELSAIRTDLLWLKNNIK